MSEDCEHRPEKEYVDEDDADDRKCEKQHGPVMIHPAKLILVEVPVGGVGDQSQKGGQPAQQGQPAHPESLLQHCVGGQQPEEGALAHHPRVGREHEEGGDHVKDAAPDRVLGPDTGIEQHQDIPEQPGDVIEGHAEEEVNMDLVSATFQ